MKILFLWLLIFLIAPVFIATIIMHPIIRPLERLLPSDDPKQTAFPAEIIETPFNDYGSAFFNRAPIKLSWYTICLNNKNRVLINGIEIKTPYENDPEAGAMEAWINYQDSSRLLVTNAPVGREKCNAIKIDKQVVSTTILYRQPSACSFPPVLKITSSTPQGDVLTLFQNAKIDSSASRISFRNQWSEYLLKLFLFFLVWMASILSIAKSWRIVKGLMHNK